MKATERSGLARLLGFGSMLLLLGKQDPNDPSATARFDYFRVYRP
jgi:hypothetical protein